MILPYDNLHLVPWWPENNNDIKSVFFFSTGCPKCQVLKKKLDNLNIHYIICDNINIMETMGIMTVPQLLITMKDFSACLLDFSMAVKWLKEYEKNEN